MALFSCQDTRSRKRQNKEQYPPQKLFKEAQLQAAQEIFDEDNQKLKNILKNHPDYINKMDEKTGYTLLMYSSIIENIPAMEMLLKMGADPNIIIPYQGLNDTPLSHAVATNNYEMLKLLLDYKASPNPAVGSSPLCDAMMLGEENTEKKMIDFLLENGADINHVSYLGDNIMEAATRSDLETAEYFLQKGGNPKISGTELSPMAEYIQWREKERSKRQNPNQKFGKKLSNLKKILQEKYNITFPVKKDPKEEAELNMKLYENLSEKDKRSVNFNENYGEKRYQKDKILVSQQ